VPDVVSLVILEVNGHEQAFFRNFHDFRAEFPGPWDDFFLEIITKREIAQHFEIRTMAARLADTLDIGGADAFLAGRDPRRRRGLGAREIGFQRRHARIDQQDRGVVLGHQRETGQAQVFLGFKESQEFLPDVIQTEWLHGGHVSLPDVGLQ